jgi:S1-C subfamily serine protease
MGKKTSKKSRRQLSFYQLYSPCIAMIESLSHDEHPAVGTAFHIGDGYLVTARHVVEDRNIMSIIPASAYANVSLDSIEIMYPEDETVDLALIKSDFSLEYYMNRVSFWGDPKVHKVDHIQIGTHLDDWIDDGLVLFDVVVFGYPRIPTSRSPQLVAVQGQVNAIIDPYIGSNHPLFVISPTARGGFSGGPVLTKGGWLLGVMTSSLITDNSIPEVGFGAALSVEPLWHLLVERRVFPASNASLFEMIKGGWPSLDGNTEPNSP